MNILGITPARDPRRPESTEYTTAEAKWCLIKALALTAAVNGTSLNLY